MICKEIPKALYCYIGGSGTWGCEFPEDVNFEGLTVLKTDAEVCTYYDAHCDDNLVGTNIGEHNK